MSVEKRCQHPTERTPASHRERESISALRHRTRASAASRRCQPRATRSKRRANWRACASPPPGQSPRAAFATAGGATVRSAVVRLVHLVASPSRSDTADASGFIMYRNWQRFTASLPLLPSLPLFVVAMCSFHAHPCDRFFTWTHVRPRAPPSYDPTQLSAAAAVAAAGLTTTTMGQSSSNTGHSGESEFSNRNTFSRKMIACCSPAKRLFVHTLAHLSCVNRESDRSLMICSRCCDDDGIPGYSSSGWIFLKEVMFTSSRTYLLLVWRTVFSPSVLFPSASAR